MCGQDMTTNGIFQAIVGWPHSLTWFPVVFSTHSYCNRRLEMSGAMATENES